MKAEYLLFNLLVVAGPLGLGFWKPTSFVSRWPRTFLSALILAVPYIIWDALVAGRHWDFNPDYVLGIELVGLPIEEIMFFFTVPTACVFAWETLCKPHRDRQWRQPRPRLVVLAVPFVFCGLWMWTLGKEYTSLALLAFGAMIVLDRLLDVRLLGYWRFWCFLALVSALTVVFNNYLTGRPVVVYGVEYQLDIRIVTMPIEDLVYGLGLNYGVLAVYEVLKRRRRRLGDASVDGFPDDPARFV